MTNLIVAAVVFLLLHLLVSGTRLRDTLTGLVGEGAYKGLFSLASVAGLIWMGVAYANARGAPGDTVYWSGNFVSHLVQLVIQFIAVVFVVAGVMTRNPTSVGQSRAAEDQDVIQGMLRITRHPFLWGVAIWAAGHLLVNGDIASVIFFGTFLILGIAGTVSIDAKRQRELGPVWQEFAQKTSAVPFAAIAAGRQSFNLQEVGYIRLGAAVVVYLCLVGAHHHVFGSFVLLPGVGL